MQLDDWIIRQTEISAHNLALAISADTLSRERPEFDQRVVPARGSVLASRVVANWDPEPDYFFHWTRDAAVAMRAVVDLVAMANTPHEHETWRARFLDMVEFSLTIVRAETIKPAPADYRERTQRNCRRFLRTRTDLGGVHGDKLLAEPRFNPDGSIDFLKWSRPQLDGPALRALACLAYLNYGNAPTPSLLALLQADLDFTRRMAGKRSIGPWEEPKEYSHHYHVALVQLGALVHGRRFAGDHVLAWHRAESRLRKLLDKHWLPQQQVFTALLPTALETVADKPAEQLVDVASILAIMEADLPGATHSPLDLRATSTLAALERAFTAAFPINQQRPQGSAPALGRSLADNYFGGGAWYATTLGAAAFCYRHALNEPATATEWRQRGDDYLATVRWMTPADGSMSEQVDRATKQPRSARHLTWSYAALVSAVRWRRRALAVVG
ncbi:MAG TPA: glycoside hydrolase family 15 protein [Candidatus Acidoferrum sp.]|nr:glycoside hydrolase family 15 protein [Candidatus Acidoferrum sp.]